MSIGEILAETELELDPAAVGDDATATDRFRPGAGFWIGIGWLALLAVVALLADVLPLADPLRPDPANAGDPPSWSHWFGTDALGRDLLSASRSAPGCRCSSPP